MDSQRRGGPLQKRESRKKTRRQKKKFEKSEADYSEAHTAAANKNPLEWTNAEKQRAKERGGERETLLVIEAGNYRKMFLECSWTRVRLTIRVPRVIAPCKPCPVSG